MHFFVQRLNLIDPFAKYLSQIEYFSRWNVENK